MSNLALTYRNLSKHQDALDLHERTLEMRRRILGEEHPNTCSGLQCVESAIRQVLHDEKHLPRESSRLGWIWRAGNEKPFRLYEV
ncbi:hypothetical protein DL96DRAFT_1580766 [Flagelloscypha sp. PMI_526]|nr:hypothetical protein DL96DRAFT_1580766 [Flagelloscypha sp. PMI_526]